MIFFKVLYVYNRNLHVGQSACQKFMLLPLLALSNAVQRVVSVDVHKHFLVLDTSSL